MTAVISPWCCELLNGHVGESFVFCKNCSRFSLSHPVSYLLSDDTVQRPVSPASSQFSIPSYPSARPPPQRKCASQPERWADPWCEPLNSGQNSLNTCTHAYRNAEERPALGCSQPGAWKRSGRWRRVENLNAQQSFPHKDGRVCPFKHDIILLSHLSLTWNECEMMFN